MKKYISLLLALIIFTSFTLSCAEDTGTPDNTTAPATDTGEPKPETDGKLLPDIPTDENYNGFEFIILSRGPGSGYWQSLDFKATEFNADIMNDARYRRMINVEQAYGVKIIDRACTGNENAEMANLIRNNHNADTDEFSVALAGLYDAGTFSRNGFLYNLYDIPYLDLTKPWWDQKSVEDFTIQNKIYFVAGDASTLAYDTTFSVIFSKSLIDDYKLENPYELVAQNKWTIDKMSEMSKTISEDLNGNDKRDKEDKYGLILIDDAIRAALNGSRGRIAGVNQNGEVESLFNTERNYTMVQKFMELAFHESAFQYQALPSAEVEPAKRDMFLQNRVLFNITYLYTLPQLRDMETNFGVLPFPKYDENQEEYGHFVQAYGCSVFSVPSVTKEPERTGIILEALAAESSYHLRPAYYDIMLNGRIVRDQESREMLDIIFSSRVYDLGLVFKLGKFSDKFIGLIRNRRADASAITLFAQYESAINNDIKALNEAYASLS